MNTKHPQRTSAAPTHTAPTQAATIPASPDATAAPRAPDDAALPGLVLPSSPARFAAECPFDVASTAGSAVAVLCDFVCAVVANVCVAVPKLTAGSEVSMKTSANPGAGTGTTHVLAVVSHEIVLTERSPLKRPSTWNCPPSVWVDALG